MNALPRWLCGMVLAAPLAHAETLPGTQPLERSGDFSTEMVAGISHWLERETQRTSEERTRTWQAAANGPQWAGFAAHRRELLRRQLGMVDSRRSGLLVELSVAGEHAPSRGVSTWTASRVRWTVFDGVHGEGVLYQPRQSSRGIAIVLPDADELPERSSVAQQLAEEGWTVFAPVLVSRSSTWSGSEALSRFTNQPHREWLHRPAFEMGRTVTGYEVQKVLGLIDALQSPDSRFHKMPIRVQGTGEGGLLALVCGAIDERISAIDVSGYFGPREQLYAEPLYRNVFGFLRDFGDAELAALIAPRSLTVESRETPAIPGPPPATEQRKGAAPGTILPPAAEDVRREIDRANLLRSALQAPLVEARAASPVGADPIQAIPSSDAQNDERQRTTVRELARFTQSLVPVAERQRTAALWTRLKPGPTWEEAQRNLRGRLWREVIGKIEAAPLPPNPRTRLVVEKEKWQGYEVTLDVYPDVFAWGWLLLPRDLKPGERRPVVVCQHGLEGLPEDVLNEDHKARAYAPYKAFAARLADQGYIVYAPHNPYRGGDTFRMLQRRANPLGLSLFSFILAQHDVTTEWLASLPFVDPSKIAFYGLSYGGKSAMRLPALIDRYCLSICSGDFNEWVLKNVSTDFRASYVFTGEWEMPEWNLAFVANYAEMAMLIAPRPFMVERGHDDGVAPDEWVGYEYAKVRRGYDKLGIGDRTELEWFDGPHTINGVGTFEFLRKHLAWPPAK